MTPPITLGDLTLNGRCDATEPDRALSPLARFLRSADQRELRAIACPMMPRAMKTKRATVPLPQLRRIGANSDCPARESAGP